MGKISAIYHLVDKGFGFSSRVTADDNAMRDLLNRAPPYYRSKKMLINRGTGLFVHTSFRKPGKYVESNNILMATLKTDAHEVRDLLRIAAMEHLGRIVARNPPENCMIGVVDDTDHNWSPEGAGWD